MNNPFKNKNSNDNKNMYLKDSKVVFHTERFDVTAFEIKGKGGSVLKREAIIHPGAVVILPLVDPDKVVMIRNDRFAVGETLWELPAGTMEKEEDPIVTAKRELIEETGYKTDQMEYLLSFYSTPGFCNEILHAYVAKELNFVGQKLEETEKISVEIIGWNDLMKMIKTGQIHDSKTLTTLLYYRQFYQDCL